MKTLRFLLASAFFIFAVACSDDDDVLEPENPTFTDEWYAENASISSEDTNFTATDKGGIIAFESLGGKVTVTVECGTDWTFTKSSDAEWLSVAEDGTKLVITASVAEDENERSAEIELTTAQDAVWFATIEVTQEGLDEDEGHTEDWYAENATISSDDDAFTSTDEGGEIYFGVMGGEVVITVDCGTEWAAENSASDLFTSDYDVDAGTVTITAVQNTDTEEKTAKITLLTVESRIEFATITVTQEAYTVPTIEVGANEWHAPAVGELTTEITVTSNCEWEIENSCEWLTVEKTETGVSLTAEENEDYESRSAEFTITCTDGISSASETIEVTQDAHAYITVSESSLHFDGEDSYTITIESNYDWKYSNAPSWLTISQVSSMSMSLSSTYSTSETDVEGTITFSAGDGAENIAEFEIPVVQTGNKTMVILYDIPSDNTKLVVQIDEYATVDCTIDWGDGSELESCKTTEPDHTYATAGEYRVRITGKATDFDGRETDETYLPWIKSIKQWGCLGFEFMNLSGATNLEYVASDVAGAFSDLDDSGLELAFDGCTSLTTISGGLFDYCTLTGFDQTFMGCTSLKTIPGNLFDKCTNVTSFVNVFNGCSSLTTIPPELFDNCKKVTNFSGTFDNCISVTGESPYTVVDGVNVHLYERADHTDIFANPTTHTRCFAGCTGLSDWSAISSAGWGGNATN